MTQQAANENRIVLGDPVPWFSAALATGSGFDLHVSAGRWVVLSFMGSPENPRAMAELTELMRESASFSEDHIIIGCVFTSPPVMTAAPTRP